MIFVIVVVSFNFVVFGLLVVIGLAAAAPVVTTAILGLADVIVLTVVVVILVVFLKTAVVNFVAVLVVIFDDIEGFPLVVSCDRDVETTASINTNTTWLVVVILIDIRCIQLALIILR